MGTWLFRIGISVIGFILAIILKDAKKSLDQVPGLAATVVEMQKAKQNFFKDRTVFYATFPIRDQARRGEWDYRLEAVYCVGILDFVFDDEDHRQDVLTTVKLKDQHGEVFYDKLTYLYLQMPNFRKTELELESHFDKWLYFLKHLASMDDIPQILREPIFEQGFALASLAAMVLGWLLARYAFEFSWNPSPWVPLAGAAAGALLALAAGWWGLQDVLRRPVVETLRRATAE